MKTIQDTIAGLVQSGSADVPNPWELLSGELAQVLLDQRLQAIDTCITALFSQRTTPGWDAAANYLVGLRQQIAQGTLQS
jgi:hypothetical protein